MDSLILTLSHPWEGLYEPLDFFKIIPKRLSLRGWNLWLLVFTLKTIMKNIQLNDISASYVNVITKNDGAKFTVKFSEIRKKERLIKSNLNKIFTFNRIVVYKMCNTLQKRYINNRL